LVKKKTQSFTCAIFMIHPAFILLWIAHYCELLVTCFICAYKRSRIV